MSYVYGLATVWYHYLNDVSYHWPQGSGRYCENLPQVYVHMYVNIYILFLLSWILKQYWDGVGYKSTVYDADDYSYMYHIIYCNSLTLHMCNMNITGYSIYQRTTLILSSVVN